jgi:phosphatidylglycerol:prolipoprotein diacylglycerol transferase
MIDPIIFQFEVAGVRFALHWYGVLIMLAVLVGTWLTTVEAARRGSKTEFIWDALPVVLIAGIVGARLWYVLNATLGGSTYYTSNPIKILMITEGGLHIFGALLLGGLTAYLYLRRAKANFWLVLDSAAPALLIAQAVARPANFINQELYGQPTTLPWGIPIDAAHRLPQYANLVEYPVETTRFHPTFAYEMIWNLIMGGLLLWAVRRFPQRFKPGMAFAAWLVLAGIGRFIVEGFRPDQPLIPGTTLSYSGLVAALMAVGGAVWLFLAARWGTPQSKVSRQEPAPAASKPAAAAHSPRTARNIGVYRQKRKKK